MTPPPTGQVAGLERAPGAFPARPLALEWIQLLKVRIAAMVGFAAFVGALLAAGPAADLLAVVEAALWVTCVAGASTIFNQVIERDTDRLMRRTMLRPLVTGRLRLRDAILVGALMALAGTLGLALRFNTLSALLALSTLVAYALVYTPLKRVSTLNTVVGALPGAMPPVLGYAALAGEVQGWAWYLFAVLFAWQFPHFLAIAWMYREDYARAGLRMLPCVENSRGLTGRQALLYSLALVPVSLMPAVSDRAGPVYALAALLLGLAYAGAALRFALREDRPRARALLLTSLVYLPALYSVTLLDPVVRAACARLIP
jgi:protoheme IX farnesyltransferase